MKYELDKTSGSARRGRLVFERPQGTFTVETPAFMPLLKRRKRVNVSLR